MKKVFDGNNFLYHVGGRTAIGIQRCADEHSGQRLRANRIGLHHLCIRARSREDVDKVAADFTAMGAHVDRGPLDGFVRARLLLTSSSRTPTASVSRSISSPGRVCWRRTRRCRRAAIPTGTRTYRRHLVGVLAELGRRARRARAFAVEGDRQADHLRAAVSPGQAAAPARTAANCSRRGELADVVDRAARHARLLQRVEPLGARFWSSSPPRSSAAARSCWPPAPRSWRNFGSVAQSGWPSTCAQRAHSRSLPGARQSAAGRRCRRSGRARSRCRRCRAACGTLPVTR